METHAVEHNYNDISVRKHTKIIKLDVKETAQYIADMVLELRQMAKAAEIQSLQDILELCFYQAFAAANKVEIPEGELEHLRELSEASRMR